MAAQIRPSPKFIIRAVSLSFVKFYGLYYAIIEIFIKHNTTIKEISSDGYCPNNAIIMGELILLNI